MEISLREWLVVGGVIVIVLIIFDGWRRVRGSRNSLRMDIDRKLRDLPDDPVAPSSNPELPYGGARPMSGEVPEFVPKRKQSSAYAAKMAAMAQAADEAATEPAERIEPTFGFSADSRQPSKPGRAEPAADLGAESASEHQPRAPLHTNTGAEAESRSAFRAEPDSNAQSAAELSAARTTAPRAEPQSSIDADPLFDEPTEDDYPAPRRASFSAFESAGADSHPSTGAEPPESAERKAAAGSAQKTAQQTVAQQAADTSQTGSHNVALGETDPLFEDLPPAPLLDLEKPIPLLMERNRQPKAAHAAPVSPDKSRTEALPSAGQAKAAPQQDLLFGNAPEQPEQKARPSGRAAEPAATKVAKGDSAATAPNPDSVLVITVVSSVPAGFPGGLLYKILSACDLHFGDMDIFHRHEDGSDTGPVQFSMANAVNPGTFDLATIDEMRTQAVTFFMSMREPRDVMNAFECMLATAETLAQHLDGDLLDENRSVLRPQTKEHYRQRIRDFEMHNRSRRGGSRV